MFIQKEWIEGDPGQPPPPPGRKWIRNNVKSSSAIFLRSKLTHAYFETGLETFTHRRRFIDAR